MTHLFLHIGLPKTGTTTIQAALDACAADLAAAGVLVPGGGHPAHRLAGFDLVGERVRGEDAAVAGAFERLAEEVRRHPGPQAVISEEELARARPRQVRRLTGTFAGHPLTLVVGVRDLARTITSAWQQGVLLGGTATWAEYAAAVRDPSTRGGAEPGRVVPAPPRRAPDPRRLGASRAARAHPPGDRAAGRRSRDGAPRPLRGRRRAARRRCGRRSSLPSQRLAGAGRGRGRPTPQPAAGAPPRAGAAATGGRPDRDGPPRGVRRPAARAAAPGPRLGARAQRRRRRRARRPWLRGAR